MGMAYGFQINDRFESYMPTQINQFMFRRRDATWDNPTKNQDMVKKDGFYDIDRIKNYLYDTCHLAEMDIPFFWKNPTHFDFNAPVWEKAFDDPTWIRILRHPMDTALSLTKKQRAIPEKEFEKPEPNNSFPGTLDRWPSKSKRCQTPEDTLGLIREIHNHKPDVDYHRIIYEDLLENPRAHIWTLSEMFDFQLSPQRARGIAEMIDPDQARKFEENKKAVRLWKQELDSFDEPTLFAGKNPFDQN